MKCEKCGINVSDLYMATPTMCKDCFAKLSPAKPVAYTSTLDYNKNVAVLPNHEAIRDVVLNNAIKSAIVSLFSWGMINLLVWFYLGSDNRDALSKISASDFFLFVYGGAIIGGVMLSLGLLGTIVRSSVVGWFDGLALIAVGLWNVLSDFILISALKEHGYSVRPDTGPHLWVMLGIAQIIWGTKQLIRFGSLGAKPKGIGKVLSMNTSKSLSSLMKEPVDPNTGRLKIVCTSKSFPFFTESTEEYTMWLLQEKAICISKKLNNLFEIDRKEMAGTLIDRKRVLELRDTKGNFRRIAFVSPSLSAFEDWIRVE